MRQKEERRREIESESGTDCTTQEKSTRKEITALRLMEQPVT